LGVVGEKKEKKEIDKLVIKEGGVTRKKYGRVGVIERESTKQKYDFVHVGKGSKKE